MNAIPVFTDHPTLRKELLAASTRRFVTSNQFIYFQEDKAESLYFVYLGHVRLSYLMEDGSAVLLDVLSPGASFGEVAIFGDGTYCDTASAIGDTVISVLPLKVCRELANQYPELDRILAGLLARRYRSYVDITNGLSRKSLAARLAGGILRLADSLGETIEIRGRCYPSIGAYVNQSDFGMIARGARGNINRILRQWRENGWIDQVDRALVVLQRSRLEMVIQQGEDMP